MMPLPMFNDLPMRSGAPGEAAIGDAGDAESSELQDFAAILSGLDPLLLQALAGAASLTGDAASAALDGNRLPAGGNPLPLPPGLRGALLTAFERFLEQQRMAEPLPGAASTTTAVVPDRGERPASVLPSAVFTDADTGAPGGGARPSTALPGSAPGASPASGGAAAPLPLGQPQFDRLLGQRLVMMVHAGGQHARVQVSPEHLGPIDLRLRLDGDALQLTLSSPHAAVRETLEQALPRLRDALAEAGVTLTQADVGEGGDGAAADDRGRGTAEADTADGAVDEEQPAPAPLRVSALVDTFA